MGREFTPLSLVYQKIERLESELQLAIPREDNEDDGPLPVPKKLVFVDDEAEVGSVARRLLAADRKKRARTETEAEEEDSKKPSREQRELAARKERADKLRQMNQEADLQKALMGKGAKKKVGNRYVWKQERKR